MLIQIFLVLAMLAIAFAGLPSSQTFTASVKEASVNGLEGLNINWEAPFNIKDYIVGFKYSFGSDFKKLPEQFFVRKQFATGPVGNAFVDANFDTSNRVVGVRTNWNSEEHGVSVGVVGDSKNYLTEVSMGLQRSIKNVKFHSHAVLDKVRNKVSFVSSASHRDVSAQVAYDTEKKNPQLSVSYNVDDENTVTPSIALKTGEMTYAWRRRLTGGSILARFNPGNNVELEWRDRGSHGNWVTRADIPVKDQSKTKVTFSREWNY